MRYFGPWLTVSSILWRPLMLMTGSHAIIKMKLSNKATLNTVKYSTVSFMKEKLILYLLFVTRHVSQKTQWVIQGWVHGHGSSGIGLLARHKLIEILTWLRKFIYNLHNSQPLKEWNIHFKCPCLMYKSEGGQLYCLRRLKWMKISNFKSTSISTTEQFLDLPSYPKR